MDVVIETSKKQMKYLLSDCRQSPVADAAGFFLFDAIWGMEIGAKPVDMEKMLQVRRNIRKMLLLKYRQGASMYE